MTWVEAILVHNHAYVLFMSYPGLDRIQDMIFGWKTGSQIWLFMSRPAVLINQPPAGGAQANHLFHPCLKTLTSRALNSLCPSQIIYQI